MTEKFIPPRRDLSRINVCSKEALKTMSADSISRMFLQAFRNERSLLLMTGLLLLMYFFIMDIALYVSLQNTTLIDQAIPSSYSPFRPLSVKLLMTAPTNHYIISLTSEYFEEFTHFAKVFSFITPNMVSFTHLFLGFVSAKFVTSESLRQRRLGVVVFEIRMWLDVYDGIIYRVHRGEVLYQSNRESMGYFVDILCDTTAGMALCFGVLFYLWKTSQTRIVTLPDYLPRSKSEENGIAHSAPGEKIREKNPKSFIFIKVMCFGLCMALVGMTWDKTVEKSANLFETKMDTTIQKVRIKLTF